LKHEEKGDVTGKNDSVEEDGFSERQDVDDDAKRDDDPSDLDEGAEMLPIGQQYFRNDERSQGNDSEAAAADSE
jgi:hypothetical protein